MAAAELRGLGGPGPVGLHYGYHREANVGGFAKDRLRAGMVEVKTVLLEIALAYERLAQIVAKPQR